MGSAPSRSPVKAIHVASGVMQRERPLNLSNVSEQSVVDNESTSVKCNSTQSQKLTDELLLLKEMLKKERLNLIKAEKKTQTLQEKLDAKEEELLCLRSEMRSLSDHVLQQQSEMAESATQLRDQYIEKLEDELKQQKNETTRLSGRYDRKLRKVRELLSKSRQDSALKLFEMKDENAKLTEDNLKLQERLDRISLNSVDSRFGSAGSRKSCNSADTVRSLAESSDNRTTLILELSEQVSQMDAENVRLKEELRNAKKIIEKVERAKIKALKRVHTQHEQNNVISGAGNELTESKMNGGATSCVEAVR